MALLLQSAFAGLSLRCGAPRRQQPFTSNGTVQKLSMKSKKSFQVEVGSHASHARAPIKLCSLPGVLTCILQVQPASQAFPLRSARPLRRAVCQAHFMHAFFSSRKCCAQVVVGNEEATDFAMKRFRREVMAAGVIPEVCVWVALVVCERGRVLN
jgi:hypothetical protein